MRHHSRREFIRTACLAGAGLAAGVTTGCSSPGRRNGGSARTTGQAEEPAASAGDAGWRGRVCSRADGGVFATAGGHDPGRVRELVQRAVADLVGVPDPREAFRALFKPTDVVAIKVNCLAGPGLSSSPAVVDALCAGLRDIGIANGKIIIWERTSDEMKRAGFHVNRYSEVRPLCFGNDDGGFQREIEFSGEVGSLWASTLARRATALINVPVLKDHDLSGVGCGMKNMYGAIHNPNRYHDNNCDPFVADVSAHPHVRDSLKLVLCDALDAQYHGGPARVAAHQWRPSRVLAAADPVALDRVAEKLLEDERRVHGMATLAESGRPAKWIVTADEKHGLGESSLSKIKLKEEG